MANLADLRVAVGVDASQWTKGLKSTSDDRKGMDKEIRSMERSFAGFEKIGTRMVGFGTTLTATLTAPLLGVGAAGTVIASRMEQAEVAFKNLLGSGQKARAFMEELKSFAATTPFEFPDLVESAKRMLAMGFEADKLVPTLRVIGDAVAGIGGGSAEINRVTLALGQMGAKGKVSAQEMNQLAELGIPAWKFLADQIGVSIPQAMKLAERGAIEASVAIPAILDGMNQKFGGMMAEQSKTLAGVWSNAKDQIGFVLGDIGKVLAPTLKGALDSAMPVLEVVKGLTQAFADLPQPVKTVALGLGAAAIAAGPLLIGLGTMMQAVPAISAAMAVLGGVSLAGLIVALKVAAVAVAGLAVAWVAWKYQDYIPGLILLKGAVSALVEWFGFLFDKFKMIPGVAGLIDKLTTKAKGVKDEFGKAAGSLGTMAKEQLGLGKSTADLAKLQEKFAGLLGGTAKATKDVHEKTRPLVIVNQELAAMMKRLNAEKAEAVKRLVELKLAHERGEIGVEAFNREVEAMIAAVRNVDSVVGNVAKITMPEFVSRLQQLTPPANAFKDALKQLGITGSADLKKVADEAAKARDVVLGSSDATDFEKKTAVYRALKAQVDAAVQMGQEVPQKTKDALAAMEAEMGEGKGKGVVGAAQGMFTQVSTVITNFAQNAAKALFDGDMSWGEKLKTLWGDLKTALVSTFIEPATKALADFVSGVLSDLIGGKGFGGILGRVTDISSTIKEVFTGGGSSGVAGAVGGAAGGAGSAAGAAGQVAGTAVSAGVTSLVGAISGVATAVSSIVGNFQMAGMNKSLDLIEHEVRFSQIHLKEILEKGVNLFLAELPTLREFQVQFLDQHAWRIHDVWERLGQLTDLVAMTTNDHLARIVAAVEAPAGAAAGTGITINFNNVSFANRSDIDYAVSQVSRNLR